jgi:hypothetical protein
MYLSLRAGSFVASNKMVIWILLWSKNIYFRMLGRNDMPMTTSSMQLSWLNSKTFGQAQVDILQPWNHLNYVLSTFWAALIILSESHDVEVSKNLISLSSCVSPSSGSQNLGCLGFVYVNVNCNIWWHTHFLLPFHERPVHVVMTKCSSKRPFYAISQMR